MAHGPVASVLNAPAYLQMYKGGIILEECPISPDQIFKKTSPSYFKFQSGIGLSSHSTLWDKGIEYEFVNHSITILGWGAVDEDGDESVFMDDNVDWDEHKANSYWIVANSWGPAFGEDGFFRVRRGWDDFAIESEALAIIPLLNEDQLDDNFKNDKYLS